MPKPQPNPTFPCTILIDSKEQIPYAFAGGYEPDDDEHDDFTFAAVPADQEAGGGVWRIKTERINLPTADYSLDGYATAIAVERKSVADLFKTVGQGRERFQRELERLNDMQFAAVVVEGQWSEVIFDPPLHAKMPPRTIYRSVLAWQQRFPRVHWWFVPDREFAEVTTFRIFERFLKEQAESPLRKPRVKP